MNLLNKSKAIKNECGRSRKQRVKPEGKLSYKEWCKENPEQVKAAGYKMDDTGRFKSQNLNGR